MAVKRSRYAVWSVALVVCLAALLVTAGLGALLAGAQVMWVPDGIPMTGAAGDDRAPLVVPDGSGGAVTVFFSNAMTIAAQRVNALGVTQWGADGVPVFSGISGTVTGFDAIPDGSGGVFVCADEAGGKVWGQHVDAAGAYPWGAAGVAMHTGSNDSQYPRMCPDGSGGFMAAWEDRLNPGGDYDILAQQVNAAGTALWNAVAGGGAYVYSGSGAQTMPQAASGSSGVGIFAWQDERSGDPYVYTQALNAAGTKQWTADGVIVGEGGWSEYDSHGITSDGVGGAVIGWEFPGTSPDIYAQRFNSSGMNRWAAGGVAACDDTAAQWRPQVVSNGAQGAFVAWDDYRYPNADVYCQNLTSNGDPFWAYNGFQVTVQPETQREVRAAPDGEGGIIMTWMDGRHNREYEVYAQRLNDVGNEFWTSTGVQVCSLANGYCLPVVANTGGGQAIVAWQDTRNVGTSGYDIYAQRILTSGSVLPTTWYFAEGTTQDGFMQYFSVQNVNAAASNVRITYMLTGGATQEQSIVVPGRSRVTVDVNSFLGAGVDNSAQVETTNDVPVVVERPMYFNYKGVWTGGHDVMGVNQSRQDWYFAEGTTRTTFDQYVCLQNAENTNADVRITFMLENSQTVFTDLVIGPRSRVTLPVSQVLGTDKDNSAHVHSTNGVPIVAERPMYFDYNEVWTGGHCAIGAPSPATAWFFAEGTTLAGFDQYICIQNPEVGDADVKITYMLMGGATQEQTFTVPLESRFTVNVKDVLGEGVDNSALVETTNAVNIVVERPMYFNYRSIWTGGHDVVGTNAPRDTWYFAEGTTRAGFEEWLCLQNPNGVPVEALVTYMLGDGTNFLKTVVLPATSRVTIYVNNELYGEHDVSVRVESADGSDIVVERPMYFSYGGGGWTGGSDVLGY